MKRSTLLKIVKPLLFAAILCAVFSATFSVLWMPEDLFTTSVRRFYELPENTVDAILIGSSAITEYYIAPEAFHENGLLSYPLATGHQPFGCIRFLMEEALKSQNPRVFVVDIRSLLRDSDDMPEEERIRCVSDSMKFTLTRLRMLEALLTSFRRNFPDAEVNAADYIFSFRKYHSRWEDITINDLTPDPEVCMGYKAGTVVESFAPVPSEKLEAAPMPIPESSERDLRELLAYCRTLKTPVLFIDVPTIYNTEQYAELNYAKDLIRAEGFEVLDTTRFTEEMELDFQKDFQARIHLNTFGALKFTDWLAGNLVDRYGISAHTGSSCEKWSESYERFLRLLLKAIARSDQYFEALPKYEKITVVVSCFGDAARQQWQETFGEMRTMGLNPVPEEWTDRRYLAVLSDGQLLFEQTGTGPAYSGKCGDRELTVSCGEGCSVLLDGEDYGTAQDGMLVTVIDNSTGEVLDSVRFSVGEKNRAFRGEEL